MRIPYKYRRTWYALKKKLRPYVTAAAILLAVFAAYLVFPKVPFIRELAESAGFIESDKPPALAEGEARVTFLFVGKADCALIESAGEFALIDSGTSDCSGDILDALRTNGVKRLKYAFLTHPHADHAGSMSDVLESIGAEGVVYADWPNELLPDSQTWSGLKETVGRLGIPVLTAKAGEEFALGDGVFTVLYAGGRDGFDLNNNSLVLRFEAGGCSFLFMGDGKRDTEKLLCDEYGDLGTDVLKAGHHGSSGTCKAAFLETVSPKYVVISCDEKAEPDYPDPDTEKAITKAGATELRTDLYGDISFTVSSGALKVSTEYGAKDAS